MSDAEQRLEIARAREQANLARMRFSNALDAAVQRVSPDRLKDDALNVASARLDQAKQDLKQRLKHVPLGFGIAGGLIAASLFWRPARVVAKQGAQLAALAWTYRNLWKPKT